MRRTVVVFDGVTRAHDFGVFQAGNGADEFVLDLEGETGGNAVDVIFGGVATLGFEEELVALLFGELDDLVFDRGAISRAGAFDSAGIHGGLIEIGADDVVGAGVGMGDPARYLFHVELSVRQAVQRENVVRAPFEQFGHESEGRRRLIAILALARLKINRSSGEPAWGAGFETADLKPEFPEAVAQGGGGVAHPPAGLVLEADMEQPAHESAGGDDNRAAMVTDAEVGLDAGRRSHRA